MRPHPAPTRLYDYTKNKEQVLPAGKMMPIISFQEAKTVVQPGVYWCFPCICPLQGVFCVRWSCSGLLAASSRCSQLSLKAMTNHKVPAKQNNSLWNEAALRSCWDLWPTGWFKGGVVFTLPVRIGSWTAHQWQSPTSCSVSPQENSLYSPKAGLLWGAAIKMQVQTCLMSESMAPSSGVSLVHKQGWRNSLFFHFLPWALSSFSYKSKYHFCAVWSSSD